jgi:hypothetical protein
MRCASSVSCGGSDGDGDGDGKDFFSLISRIAGATESDRRRRRGYIPGVKRKACAKLNFPRRGRLLPGIDATATGGGGGGGGGRLHCSRRFGNRAAVGSMYPRISVI